MCYCTYTCWPAAQIIWNENFIVYLLCIIEIGETGFGNTDNS